MMLAPVRAHDHRPAAALGFGNERDAQALDDVLALSKERGPFAMVVIVADEGRKIEMGEDVLTSETRWPTLRYNRRGKLIFTLYDVEKGRRKAHLRGVHAIRLDRDKPPP